jgi:hypothetical protein
MARTSTPNYGLSKPTPGTAEPVSAAIDVGSNWDLVDQDMNRFDRQVFTSSGNWSKPARAKRIKVYVQGGGGSGGGCAATAAGQIALSGAGGGGGYCEKLFLAATLGSSETVTIGAGGVAATAGNNVGNTGGNSVFSSLTANGGVGGTGGGAGTGSGNVAGGAGGTATGGDINIPGSDGCNAIFNNTIGHATSHGGASHMSGQARMAISGTGTTGTVGKQYGGGSSGSANYAASQAAKASEPGAPGIVIVDTYY